MTDDEIERRHGMEELRREVSVLTSSAYANSISVTSVSTTPTVQVINSSTPGLEF